MQLATGYSVFPADLCKGGCRHLDTAFIRRIDLEVMPECRMQPQQAEPWRLSVVT